MLDQVMEYTGAVGAEVVDMLTVVHEKVWALEPQVPNQHTFRGDGLQNFIQDHQDRLEQLEDQLRDLMTMIDVSVHHQDIALEAYHWDLRQVERLNGELLVWVAALEHGQGNPIRIDNPELLPMPPPGGLGLGSMLVEINDGVDDEWNQVVMEDQVEGVVRRRVTIEEGGVFGVVGELYEEGEDIMDIL